MNVYVGMDVHRKRSQIAVVEDTATSSATATSPTGIVALSRNAPGSPAKWRLSFMKDAKKGSNHSTVP